MHTRRPRLTTALVTLVALTGIVGIVGCGGGVDPDRKELERIKTAAESTFDDRGIEALLTDAIAIGTRNRDTAVGDEAMAFAEQTFLAGYRGADDGLFADRAAAPPTDLEDEYLTPFRSLVGFLDVLPAGYEATTVRDRFGADLTERVDHYMFRLDEALANRRQWAADLHDKGTTQLSFTGQETEDAFAQYTGSMRYLRRLAADAAQSEGFLADVDLVIDALVVAAYAPPTEGTTYENDVLVTTYTKEAVTAGIENADLLEVAIAAARERFPDAP